MCAVDSENGASEDAEDMACTRSALAEPRREEGRPCGGALTAPVLVPHSAIIPRRVRVGVGHLAGLRTPVGQRRRQDRYYARGGSWGETSAQRSGQGRDSGEASSCIRGGGRPSPRRHHGEVGQRACDTSGGSRVARLGEGQRILGEQ